MNNDNGTMDIGDMFDDDTITATSDNADTSNIPTSEANIPAVKSYSWDEMNERTDEYIEKYVSDLGQQIVSKDDISNLGFNINEMKEKDIQRLVKNIAYFRLVHLQHKKKSDAYNIAFGRNDKPTVASAKANGIERANTFKLVSKFMGLDLNLTFMADRLRVLSKLVETATSDDVLPRDAINASEIFLKYTDATVDDTEDRANKAVEILNEIVKKVDDKHKEEADRFEGMSVEDIIDV